MKPAHKMRPVFPAFLAPRGATPFDTDLAELGCQRPTAFALGEDGVGRLCARAVSDKFFASVRARSVARAMASVAATRTRSASLTRSESEAIVTVLLVTTAVTTFCAVATTVPIAVLDPLLSSTESRRGPAYDLPVAKPVAKDEVVQVAVPVNDYYAFRQLETAARTQDFVYHKAASATV